MLFMDMRVAPILAQKKKMHTKGDNVIIMGIYAGFTKMNSTRHSLKSDCLKAFANALGKGQTKLSSEDYKVAVLELLGYKPSKCEIDQVRKAIGHSELQQQHWINKEHFVAIMLERLKEKDREDSISEVFLAMDIQQKGFLTQSDCEAAFKEVLPKMKPAAVQSLFHEVDLDTDGRISYKDFEIMMNSIIS